MLSQHRNRTKVLGLFLAIFAVLVGGLIVLNRDRVEDAAPPPRPGPSNGIVRFGDVSVHTDSREIRFDGEVRQVEGHVLSLLHLAGYTWLQEEAAIVSPAQLADLQNAIAMLDWELWDRLWLREGRGEEVEVVIGWDGNQRNANDLLQSPHHLGLGDLVFLGSPLFDPLFLARCRQTVVCVALNRPDRCPLSMLHESVKAYFVRECGRSGYALNRERLPAVGDVVTINIRIPCSSRRGG